MSPRPQRPGKKPVRRKARTPQKEEEIDKRKFRNLINKFGHEVARIWGTPKPESKLRAHLWELEQKGRDPNEYSTLKTFLEKKGMDEQWCRKLSDNGITMAQQAILEAIGHQRTNLLSRKEEALILKEMRAFFAAIEEAKNAGIT